VVSVSAPIPYIEKEAINQKKINLEDESDFSFEHPFIIPDGDIGHSRAIFCYLKYKDYDVFKYTVAAGERVTISAAALTPAIRAYKNLYLATALIGPGLPPVDLDVELPFSVPEGMGIQIVYQTPQDERVVYVLPAEFPGTDIRWFFPPFHEMLSETVDVPGDYYLVAWNPDKRRCDFTMNIGFGENNSECDFRQMDILIPLINNGNIYHKPYIPVEGPSPF